MVSSSYTEWAPRNHLISTDILFNAYFLSLLYGHFILSYTSKDNIK